MLRCFIFAFTLQILSGIFRNGATAQTSHPLDPLSSEEIKETVTIIRATKPFTQQQNMWLFKSIMLHEPEKSLLLSSFINDTAYPAIARKSRTIVVERQTNAAHLAVVDISSKILETWEALRKDYDTGLSEEDYNICQEVAYADLQIQERCKEMGWDNMSLVIGECWTLAHIADKPELVKAVKPVTIYFYGQMFPEDNHYAHPFDFVAYIDIYQRRVLYIENLPTREGNDASNRTGNVCPRNLYHYRPELNPEIILRKVNPIRFSQPDGAGYQIEGNKISWQNFTFRIGFNIREGLSIHHVSFQEGNERRPLFYRMAVAELFVPYGDPRAPYYQKIVYDMGEFGLGLHGIDLEKARLCTGGGVPSYMTFNLNNEAGEPVPYPNVICIFEEDNGLLWAHKTLEGHAIHARSQRLTISMMLTVDNYDYKLSWHFYQDARIEFYTELHGIVNSALLAQNVKNPGPSTVRVAPDIFTQYHQHHLCMRIDPELDGNSNSISTSDILPHPDPSGSTTNPYGNAFITEQTVLKTQNTSRTNLAPEKGRTWLISNPNRIHPFTYKPVGWKLLPFVGPQLFARRDSPMRPRFAFAEHNVWVTEYQDDRLYPVGEFNINGTGLPEWVAENPNLSVENTDVVLWYIYGFTHIPRVEDWPLMPSESAGFVLKPTNFFKQSPALNVPSYYAQDAHNSS